MVFGAIAFGIGLLLTAKGVQDQQKSRKLQKRAIAERRRKDELAQNRELRQLAEESRVRRAQAQQAAINQGVATTSGIEGGLTSLTTQLGSNTGFINSQGAFADRISAFNQSAADKASSAATNQAFGSLFFQAAGNADSIIEGAKDIGATLGFKPINK
jgi:hypothetical protein